MKRGFGTIAQVSLCLLLVLSLGLMTAVPSLAQDGSASISPHEADYDRTQPHDVETTITWNGTTRVDSIHDGDALLTQETEYAVRDDDGVTARLVIFADYLGSKLKEAGQSAALMINFDVGPSVVFTITATCRPATISPESGEYDLGKRPRSISTDVTFGDATKVRAIREEGSAEPIKDSYYKVVPAPTYDELQVFADPYLKERLKRIGDSVVLIIEFDCGPSANFTITATGVRPEVRPKQTIGNTNRARYDLDRPAAVNSTITWGAARNLDRIVDRTVNGDEHVLQEDAHYTVTTADTDDVATLTINESYLGERLTDIGHEVDLTIQFDVADVQLIIRATGTPTAIQPASRKYDIVARRTEPLADATGPGVMVSIIWGTARWVDEIVDDDGHTLDTPGEYSWLHAGAMIIREEYLTQRLTNLGQRVMLTIDFDIGPSAALTIEASGRQPEISPKWVLYDHQRPGDVTANITLGSASQVKQIRDQKGYVLEQDVDYIMTDMDAEGSAKELTILDDPYLRPRLEGFRAGLVLEITFDIGQPATLEIDSGCFIATAVYGTPMAEEVQVLRRFRDECLLAIAPGRLLVDAYYSVSPRLAGFISEHPALKPAVRAGLLPALVIGTWAVNTSPVEKIAIVALLIPPLVISAVLAMQRRRKERGPT
jgi:hypothetical protein